MNDIQQMCLDHFNEPVLLSFELARLIGYAEDADDCYLIVKYPRKGVVWHTAVGGYIFLDKLKGQGAVVLSCPSYEGEVWDDFYRLDNLLEITGVTKEKEFIVDIRPHQVYTKISREFGAAVAQDPYKIEVVGSIPTAPTMD